MHEALARANFEHDAALLTARMTELQGLVVHRREYPLLDVTVVHPTSIRIRMQCDDWDELPPSIALLGPDGSPWKGPLPPGGVFNAGRHPTTGRPFICMRGSREYHTHPGHRNDAWANHRGQDGMNLVGILMQLCAVWRGGMR